MGGKRFAGKVVVVTGASSGVGRAIARAFGAEGARVGLIARSQEALENAAAEIVTAGGEARVLPLDVADAAAVEAAADQVVAEWGAIDVWVNDAMVSVFSPVKEMHAEEYRRVTEVNYLGFVYGTLAALKHMRARDAGVIIQIGSALAYRSIPLQSAYCGSKAAIRGFTDSLRSELIHDRSKVKVTMLQLPAVNTPQFDVVRNRLPQHPQPVPPIYQPEVIARAALYAAEHPSRELWVGWSAMKAILGQKFIPGLLDHYLARKAYSGQQTNEVERTPQDNVDAPLPGDRGAHGDFDDRARSHNVELWLRLHRARVGLAATLGLAAVAGAWRLSRAT
ncbi:SDR family oxidoreductase [Aggregicoccus sp. 17bor-14]|uniref:SDR family oxidoreductase n=1 Tax=Myxococcaceae TaxID=31 RepID=UPI00129C5B90|nr:MULTISPECIES: SDR family oxidoreductase [Myxococcaceae]MBF5046519.1 SDR family oxidoreductase [Simulacricoccus sp. 17bor-14]MRI92234.1 SDR family oxidoreductase [Aggregicoccus sp. 17bor-14]